MNYLDFCWKFVNWNLLSCTKKLLMAFESNLEENRSPLNATYYLTIFMLITFKENIFKSKLTSFECNFLFNNFQLNYEKYIFKGKFECNFLFNNFHVILALVQIYQPWIIQSTKIVSFTVHVSY